MVPSYHRSKDDTCSRISPPIRLCFPGKTSHGADIGSAILLSAACSAEIEDANPCHCGIHHSPATIAGQQGTDDGGTTDIDVAIGDCITPGEP